MRMSPACTRFEFTLLVICSTGSKSVTSVVRTRGALVNPSSTKSAEAALVITAPSCTSMRFDTTTGMSTANVEGLVVNVAGCSVNTPVPASQTAPVTPPENAKFSGVPNANCSGSVSAMAAPLKLPPKYSASMR